MAVDSGDVAKGACRKVVLVAEEIAFAKILAGNNKTLRDRGVKRLSSWLKARSSGTHGKCGARFNAHNEDKVPRDLFC
jgi:hypothetical protein